LDAVGGGRFIVCLFVNVTIIYIVY
jgi:hypothetical protein